MCGPTIINTHNEIIKTNMIPLDLMKQSLNKYNACIAVI